MTDVTDGPVWSRREVAAFIGVSISTLWRMVRAGRFPSPMQLSPNRVGWCSTVVKRWLADREATSRGQRS